MVKGTLKKLISTDELLKHTNGGYSIFMNEIPHLRVGRAFKSVLRKDSHPSMSISCRDGFWYVKDFSNGKSYSAISLVQAKYGLTFPQAMHKLCIEYGLKVGESKEYAPMPLHAAPEYEGDDMPIAVFEKKWSKKHFDFWEGTGVTPELCLRYNVVAVGEAAIRHRKVYIDKGEVVWAYYAPDVGGIKLYFPERDRGLKFKNNIIGKYLWNFGNIQKCEKLVVQKSVKDMLVTAVVFPYVIATQSEESRLFTDEIVEIIHGVTNNVYVSYGSDEQGVRESTILTQKYNWKWVNPAKNLLPDINDFYLLSKAKGPEAIEKLLKSKGIL